MKTRKVGKIVSLLVAIVLVATIMIPAASVLAALRDIPERDAVIKQQFFLLVYALRHGRRKHGGEHFPEAVLRVSVIKSLLARLHRRERAEYQHARMIVIDGVKGMIKYFCHSSSENFKKLLPWASGVYIIKVYKLYRGV